MSRTETSGCILRTKVVVGLSKLHFFEECDYVEIITFVDGSYNLDVERNNTGGSV